jgi:cobalamin biosynthesis Mg chelatase CobN
LVAFDNAKSGFAKKSNTGTKIFITVVVVVFVVLITVVVYLVRKAG